MKPPPRGRAARRRGRAARRRGRAAFTLIELVISVLLSALVAAGLFAVFGAALRVQMQAYGKDVKQGDNVFARKNLLRDLELATHIVQPPPPCVDDGTNFGCSTDKKEKVLIGCSNHTNMNIPNKQLDSTAKTRLFRYCVDFCPAPKGTGIDQLKCLYRTVQEDTGLTCDPAPPSAPCTSPWGGVGATGVAAETTMVAEDVTFDECSPGVNCDYYFRRPKEGNNVVEIRLKLDPRRKNPQNPSEYTVNTIALDATIIHEVVSTAQSYRSP